MSIQMTIIGMGRVGASLGLALQSYKDQIERTGTDADLATLRKAVKMGALDKSVHNIEASVEGADIVVLALPLDEVRQALEIIAPALKPGAVILDTSASKVAIAGWVKELLPPERYYLTMSPSLNPEYLQEMDKGLDSARADLFKNSLMAITAPATTHPDALRLASDITALIGAQPYYADPYEFDGLMAAADVLPRLTAAALLHAITDQPSWREGRKVAGRAFLDATSPIADPIERKRYGQFALLNAENTIRMLDDMIQTLQEARDLIAGQDQDGLHEFLETALESREKWLSDRRAGVWDMAGEKVELPARGEVFGRLFGLRPKKEDKK